MKSKESYYKVHMRINFFFLFLKLEQEVIEYDNVKQFKVFLKTLYEEWMSTQNNQNKYTKISCLF